jgi:hypothetical protein
MIEAFGPAFKADAPLFGRFVQIIEPSGQPASQRFAQNVTRFIELGGTIELADEPGKGNYSFGNRVTIDPNELPAGAADADLEHLAVIISHEVAHIAVTTFNYLSAPARRIPRLPCNKVSLMRQLQF